MEFGICDLSARRIKRLNEFIKQELGKILQKETHQGRYLLTITEVDVLPNFKYAKVKISIIPYDKEKEALDSLSKNIGRIQALLNKKLHMKFVPWISFAIDKGAKSAEAVNIILGKIHGNS
ncbi:MAG: ribosome-binding factor A [Patescibacteria group bacterium]